MRIILAAVAFFIIAQAAQSAEIFKSKLVNLNIGANLSAVTFFSDQDEWVENGNTVAPPEATIHIDGEFIIEAYHFLPNSYKIGLYSELEITGDFEAFHLYLSGPFGELQVGQPSSAGLLLQYYAPEFLAPLIDTVDWSDFSLNKRYSVSEDGALQSGDSTFFIYDDEALKITYISPSIQGLTFGFSWTPDPRKSLIGDDDSIDYYVENVITLTGQYSYEIAGIKFGVSGLYAFGDPVFIDPAGMDSSPEGYNFGANISWRGFTLGGSWQNSKDFANNEIEDRVWAAGIRYEQDLWRVGGGYRQSQRSVDPTQRHRSNREVEVGLAYELGGGLWGSGFFEYAVDENPSATTRKVESYGGGFILTYIF